MQQNFPTKQRIRTIFSHTAPFNPDFSSWPLLPSLYPCRTPVRTVRSRSLNNDRARGRPPRSYISSLSDRKHRDARTRTKSATIVDRCAARGFSTCGNEMRIGRATTLTSGNYRDNLWGWTHDGFLCGPMRKIAGKGRVWCIDAGKFL